MSAVLYLEPIGGIAGDMFLAAAVDVGVDLEALERPLRTLDVAGWRFEVKPSVRHELRGTHVDVALDEKVDHPHRELKEIQKLIRASQLSEKAKARALAVFQTIGEAEAKIHGVAVEDVHFHEVGAVDSIVDVCGAAVALELLGDPKVYAAPPPLGSGTVRSAHGNIPVPAPATLEILKGVPVRFEGVGERTTPTGAALLKTLCQVGPPPELVVERVGYGVGTKDFPDVANVLRMSVGKLAHAGAEGMFVLEANLDDCSPQLLGSVLEGALEAGAVDAYVVPATMKKSRPGHLLGALVPADRRDALVELFLAHSTTLGVRFHRVERVAVERRFEEVATPYGKVKVKLGLRNGKVVNAAPEFEDCAAAAKKAGVPVKEVWAAALVGYRQR